MSETKIRTARAIAGIACITAAVVALVWFALRFVPGTPRTAKSDAGISWMEPGTGSVTIAETITDTPLGASARIEGITQGKRFAFGTLSEEYLETQGIEEQIQQIKEYGTWEYDIPAFDITILGAKALTEDAFAEWYPHYAESSPFFRQSDAKVVLVEADIANASDETINAPRLLLWTEDFGGTSSDKLGYGLDSNGYLLSEFYGDPQDGFVSYHLPDGWSEIAPGESRTFTYPYLVYRAMFEDPAAYENFDPSRFCLAISDYDPPSIYRLWLG